MYLYIYILSSVEMNKLSSERIADLHSENSF